MKKPPLKTDNLDLNDRISMLTGLPALSPSDRVPTYFQEYYNKTQEETMSNSKKQPKKNETWRKNLTLQDIIKKENINVPLSMQTESNFWEKVNPWKSQGNTTNRLPEPQLNTRKKQLSPQQMQMAHAISNMSWRKKLAHEEETRGGSSNLFAVAASLKTAQHSKHKDLDSGGQFLNKSIDAHMARMTRHQDSIKKSNKLGISPGLDRRLYLWQRSFETDILPQPLFNQTELRRPDNNLRASLTNPLDPMESLSRHSRLSNRTKAREAEPKHYAEILFAQHEREAAGKADSKLEGLDSFTNRSRLMSMKEAQMRASLTILSHEKEKGSQRMAKDDPKLKVEIRNKGDTSAIHLAQKTPKVSGALGGLKSKHLGEKQGSLETHPDIKIGSSNEGREKASLEKQQNSLQTSVIDRAELLKQEDKAFFSVQNTQSPKESSLNIGGQQTPSLMQWTRSGGMAADKITEDTNLYHYQAFGGDQNTRYGMLSDIRKSQKGGAMARSNAKKGGQPEAKPTTEESQQTIQVNLDRLRKSQIDMSERSRMAYKISPKMQESIQIPAIPAISRVDEFNRKKFSTHNKKILKITNSPKMHASLEPKGLPINADAGSWNILSRDVLNQKGAEVHRQKQLESLNLSPASLESLNSPATIDARNNQSPVIQLKKIEQIGKESHTRRMIERLEYNKRLNEKRMKQALKDNQEERERLLNTLQHPPQSTRRNHTVMLTSEERQSPRVLIDPITSDLQPFNLRYKHRHLIDKFSKTAELSKSKLENAITTRREVMLEEVNQPQIDEVSTQSPEKAEKPPSPLSVHLGVGSVAETNQGSASSSQATTANKKDSRTESSPSKLPEKTTSMGLIDDQLNKMKDFTADKTIKEVLSTGDDDKDKSLLVGDIDTNYLINKNPQELITYLDKSMFLRKVRLKADVASEAILQGQKMKEPEKLYDIDKYSEEVRAFVMRRLRYQFKDKADTTYERLSTDAENCGVHRTLDAYRIGVQERAEEERRLEQEKIESPLASRKKGKSQLSSLKKMGTFKGSEKKGTSPTNSSPLSLRKQATSASPMRMVSPTSNQVACQHESLYSEIRRDIYQHYAQFIKFMSRYEKMFAEHLDKKKILEILQEKFYDMKNLSPAEQKLFATPEQGIQLLMHPLLYLVKQQMREQDHLLKHPKFTARRVKTTLFDNQDQTMFYQKQSETAPPRGALNTRAGKAEEEEQQKVKYFFTISKEAKDYLEALQAAFLEKTKSIVTPIPKEEKTVRFQRYTEIYHQFRLKLLKQNIVDLNISISALPEDLSQKRIESILAQREKEHTNRVQQHSLYAMPGQQSNKFKSPTFGDFITKIHSILDKFGIDKMVFKAKAEEQDSDSSDVQPPKPEIDEQFMATPTNSAAAQSGGLWTTKSALTPRGGATSKSWGRRRSILEGTFTSSLGEEQQYQKHVKLFNPQVQREKFFEFARNYQNEVQKSNNETYYFRVLKEFDAQKSKHSPIFTKIQNKKLILRSETLTDVEADILGKYLESTAHDPEFQVKVLQINNCSLSDYQLSLILKGILHQKSIQAIHLFNERVDTLAIEPLMAIISERDPPTQLQELSLVGCNKMNKYTVQKFMEFLSQENNSNLQKLALSNSSFFVNDNESFEFFFEYLLSVASQSNPFTHLDLSNMSLTTYQISKIMEALQDNQSIQFLNLSKNMLKRFVNQVNMEPHIKKFIEYLKTLLETNTKNLTHLDLSEMIDLLFQKNEVGNGKEETIKPSSLEDTKYIDFFKLGPILEIIGQYQKSLQIFHFDGNFLTLEEKVKLAQKMGILNYRMDGTIPLTKSLSSHKAELQEKFMRKSEVTELMFLKRKNVDHLLQQFSDSLEPLDQKLLNREIKKHIHDNVNYRQGEDENKAITLIQNQLVGNHFTLKRNLSMDKFDIKYADVDGKGVLSPYVDENQSTEKWQLITERIDSEMENIRQCHFCAHMQNVHLYFNLMRGGEDTAQDFQEITNLKIRQMLKKWFLPSDGKEEVPLIFGSLTNWRVMQMIPTPLYTLTLLRDRLYSLLDYDEKEKFPFSEKQILELIEVAISKMTDFRVEQLHSIFSNYQSYLDFALRQYHFTKMRYTSQFSRPVYTDITRSFFASIQATPGRHSVIVYEPKQDRFFCRNLIVDYRIQNSDMGPQSCEYQQKFDQYKFDQLATQKIEAKRSYDLLFLRDMMPENLMPKMVMKSTSESSLLTLYKHYKLINDLYIYIAANQRVKIISGHDIVTEKKVDTQEEVENRIYPCTQQSEVEAFLRGQPAPSEDQAASLSDEETFINRLQFLQIMYKAFLKKHDVGNYFKRKEPDFGMKTMGFRFFEPFLESIDPFTQAWINKNFKVFRSVFLRFSFDKGLLYYNRNDQTSYKQLGYMPLKNFETILEMVDINPAATGNVFASNAHNYAQKLRASVGMNLDYFSNDGSLTLWGRDQKAKDEAKVIYEAIQLQKNADDFLKDVAQTKNFELKEIEKKIEQKFKYTRSRFFNIDFIEFLQMLIIHCVLCSQEEIASQHKKDGGHHEEAMSPKSPKSELGQKTILFPRAPQLWKLMFKILSRLKIFCNVTYEKDQGKAEAQPEASGGKDDEDDEKDDDDDFGEMEDEDEGIADAMLSSEDEKDQEPSQEVRSAGDGLKSAGAKEKSNILSTYLQPLSGGQQNSLIDYWKNEEANYRLYLHTIKPDSTDLNLPENFRKIHFEKFELDKGEELPAHKKVGVPQNTETELFKIEEAEEDEDAEK